MQEAADQGGEPMMALAELRHCHRAGETLAGVVARLARAESGAVPPLILVQANGAGGSGSA